jgi:hypothetical protein
VYFPAAANVIVIAGFKYPLENRDKINKINAKAAPIANTLFVASTI